MVNGYAFVIYEGAKANLLKNTPIDQNAENIEMAVLGIILSIAIFAFGSLHRFFRKWGGTIRTRSVS